MSNANLDPVDVMREFFNRLGEVYASLLIIALPSLVFILIITLFHGSDYLFKLIAYFMASSLLFNIVGIWFSTFFSIALFQVVYPNNWLIIFLILLISVIVGLWYSATGFIYCHKVLNRQNITVEKAFKLGLSKIVNLLIASIILCFIFFPWLNLLLLGLETGIDLLVFTMVFPGLYFSSRLSLIFYVIAIENYSAIEGIKRSWKLTKEHWYFIFRTSSMTMGLSSFTCMIVIVFLTFSLLVVWAVIPSVSILDSEIIGTIAGLFMSVIVYLWIPFYFVFNTIMCDRLIASSKLVK